MRRVIITFDDGRLDNYEYALPVLRKYGLQATFFITTGYIDGSFCPATWKSSEGPMNIDQLREMAEFGNEIALHGDRHKTEKEDFENCWKKMSQWLGNEGKYGFSIPGSHYDREYLERFMKDEKERLLYVRGGSLGRGKNNAIRKILKGLRVYTNCRSYFAYYNSANILPGTPDRQVVPSIGIRETDKPGKIQYLLDKMPDGHSVVFMFHSILPDDSPRLGQDPWCWSLSRFESFCRYLSEEASGGGIQVVTMRDLFKR